MSRIPQTELPTCHAWELRTRTIRFGRWPALVGIVNVTPDSFSDGGRFFDPRAAIEHGLQLAADGAAMLDIGGESTRPYSQPVDTDEELRRVIPVVQALCEQTSIPVSIDTSKAAVAAQAVAAGAQVINDVTALLGDPRMIGVALETGAGVCAMHMRGTPQTMQDDPRYDDVVGEVKQFLRQRKTDLVSAGIAESRICLDPGIGFGKTSEHNQQLLAACDQLHQLQSPILVGHSRKGFLKKLTGDPDPQQLAGTLAVTLHLARCGIQLIRLHDVLPARQALAVLQAIGPAL